MFPDPGKNQQGGGSSGSGGIKRGRKRRRPRSEHGSGRDTLTCSYDHNTASASTTSDDPTHRAISSTASLHVNFRDFATKYSDFAKAWDDLKHRRQGAAAAAATTAATARTTSSSFSTHVDSAFNLALTRATLQSNLGLCLPSLPDGYLCPPIPNRLNYVLWLNTLLRESGDSRYFELSGDCSASSSSLSSCEYKYRYRGLDIGCGASCIYPLLLCTDKFSPGNESTGATNKWRIFATDIDEESVKSAKLNVQANSLDDRIEVALVPRTRRQVSQDPANEAGDKPPIGTVDDDVVGPVQIAMEAFRDRYHYACASDNDTALFDFCMTNPPFYGTEAEATADRMGDGRSRTDMSISEGVYPGGEVGFVRDMIADSVQLTNSITWFTSMLARKTSLVELEKELRGMLGRGAVRTATFVQGKTTRWGIAWTHRRVAARSPATRVVGGLQGFKVGLKRSDGSSAIEEVASRVRSYCQYIESTKGLHLDCTIKNVAVDSPERGGTEICSITERGSVQHPGAFCIDIHLQNVDAVEKEEEDGKEFVHVGLDCFVSSFAGTLASDKVRSGMEGEIQRSNRRWRRILTKGRDETKC